MGCKVHAVVIVILLMVSLIYGQSTDATSVRDKVCIANSVIKTNLDGTYQYSFSSSNGFVYNNIDYNETEGMYLVPDMSSALYKYRIQPKSSVGTPYSFAYCSIYNPPAGYTMNPDDCYKGWFSYNPEYDDDFVYDPSMRVVNCNDLCVTGNTISWLNGNYIWLEFSLITNSSIFYCEDCDYAAFIYAWPDDMQWLLGSDPTSSSTKTWASCTYSGLASNGMVSLDNCGEWVTFDSADMKVKKYQCSTESNGDDSAYYVFLLLLLFAIICILVLLKLYYRKNRKKDDDDENVPMGNDNDQIIGNNNSNVVASGNNNTITIVNSL